MASQPDARAIITPDSFTVAPELLGLPLAPPWRRALAFLLDLVPVGILANAGLGVFLIFVGPFLAWRALSAFRPRSFAGRASWNAVRAGAAFVALLVAVQIAGVGRGWSNPEAAQSYAPQPDSLEAMIQRFSTMGYDASAAQSTAERLVELERENRELEARLAAADGDFMDWVRRMADVLGIGFGWGAVYFTSMLVLGKGQTPGKRLLGVRVIRLDARPIGWWLAFERFGGYFASVSTGLFGFLQIFWDRNRQALHDKAVETVVIRERRDITPATAAAATPPARR